MRKLMIAALLSAALPAWAHQGQGVAHGHQAEPARETGAYMGLGVRNSVGSTLLGANYRFRHKSALDSWRVGIEGWSNVSNPPVTTTTTVTAGALHHPPPEPPPPPPPPPEPRTLTTSSTCDDANAGAYAAWAPQWRYFYAMAGVFYATDDDTCNVGQHWLGYAAAVARLPATRTIDITFGLYHKSDFGGGRDENHWGPGVGIRF